MLKYCVVVPCVNESNRILNNEYIKFSKENNDFQILFDDDGSTENTIDEPFLSSWLFDIEIIWRIVIKFGKSFFRKKAIEIPLQKLIDRGRSKIDLIFLPFEFLKIHFHYKNYNNKNRC